MAAIVFIGSGVVAAGNNAPVTPTMPASLVAGDCLLLFASVREDAATIDTPSGWTQLLTHTGTSLPAEQRVSVFERRYVIGDVAPTVTFTNSGNNDTTLAIIIALRNVDTAAGYFTPGINGGIAVASGSTTVSFTDPIYAGDAIIAVSGMPGVATLSPLVGRVDGVDLITYSTGNSSTLGSDASLTSGTAIATLDSVVDGTSAYTMSIPITASHVLIYFSLAQTRNRLVQTGAGGIKAGGSATVETRSATIDFTGSGGSKFGGFAETTYSPNSFTGAGGVRVGGAATASLREATTTVVASGGMKVGGAADYYLLSPTSYHIDYFNGNDSNDGLTWGTAFKTFRPISNRTVTLTGGDIVKIARTPDGQSAGVFLAAQPLAGYSYNEPSYSNGWRGVTTGLTLPSPLLGRVITIHPMNGPTGGVVAASGSLYYEYPVVNTNTRDYGVRAVINGTAAVGTKFFYVTTATTLNLSTLSRLEIKLSMHIQSLTGTAPAKLTLRLCSDTLGNTGIQDITLVPDKQDGCIWSYEGPLPNGVASVGFYMQEQGTSYYLYLRSFIATYPHNHPNYIGHFTLWRIGDHEGTFYAPVDSFGVTSGTPTLKYHSCVVGASNLYGTNMTVYYKNVISMSQINWDGKLPITTSYYYSTGVLAGGVSAEEYRTTCGHLPSLDLTGLQGVAEDPIVIECGYDPQTDTIAGTTHIINADTAAHYYSSTPYCLNGLAPIYLDNTSHVTIKNLDMFSYVYGLFVANRSESKNLKFENCEFITPLYGMEDNYYYSYYEPMMPCTFRIYNSDTADNTNIHDFHFTDCKGTIWPFGPQRQRPAALEKLRNFTYTDCVFYPYGYRRQQTMDSITGLNKPAATFAPLTVEGGLKVYCLPGNGLSESYFLVGPSFVNNTTATITYYRGARLCLSPAMPVGDYNGVYTYPPMQLYDTHLLFFSSHDSLGETYGPPRGGRPSYQVVNGLTITAQSANWCLDMVNAADSYCVPEKVISTAYGYQVPPVEVNGLTLAGAPKLVSNSNGNAILGTVNGSLHVKNVTVSAGWLRVMVCGPLPTMNTSNTFSDAGNLAILENMAVPSNQTFAYIPNYSIFGGVVGLLDVRNVSINYTGSYIPTSHVSLEGVVRLQECSITGVTPIFAKFPARYQQGGGLPVPATGRSSVIIDGGTAVLGSTVTATTTYEGITELSCRNVDASTDMRFDIPIIRKTPTTYVIYSHFYILSKDYTIYVSPPFAWKSFLKSIAYNMWSRAYPLGSVPLQSGHSVTFSINLRRSTTTNCKARLFVVPHGSAGYGSASQYLEKVAEHTDGANVWQNVSISYAVVQDALVDIYVSHSGAAGTSIWFDDVRVTEL